MIEDNCHAGIFAPRGVRVCTGYFLTIKLMVRSVLHGEFSAIIVASNSLNQALNR